MQVNKFVTMTVGLIVGVLLIAGVVAPVIANVSSDNGGGDSTTTLRNDSGDTDYYFKPVTQSTSIRIVSGSSPYMICAYVGESSEPTQEWSSHLVLAGDTWTVTTSNDGHFWMSNTDGSGYTVYSIDVNGSEVTLNDGDGWVYPEGVRYYSWYEGDYVVPMSSSTGRQVVPYLASDSQIYIGMGLDDGSRVTVVGSKDSNTAHYVYVENYNPVFEDLGTADVSIENNKLKSVTCTYNSVAITFDWNTPESYIEYAIVPVEVTVSGSNNTESLRNGYWKMAESGEWDLYVDYLGNNMVGLFFEDPVDSDPFFEIELVNGNTYDLLPVLIGEGFFAFVLYDPYMNDWEPQFSIDSEEGIHATDSIHISGTSVSYYTGPGELYTLDGLIAHISDEGGYTAYTSVSPAKILYSAFEYLCDRDDSDSGNYYVYEVMGTVDDSAYMWSIGSRGIAGTSTDGNIPWAMSNVSYVQSDGKYDGMTITGSFDTESFSETIPFGAVESYDEATDIWVLTTAFAIGPIDNGGGSGIPSTLGTVLTVIPLVMTVGLVLGAIGFMRMKE